MTPAELTALTKALDDAEDRHRAAIQPGVAESQALLRARCVEYWEAERELPVTSGRRFMLGLRQRVAEASHNSLLAQHEFNLAVIHREVAIRFLGPSAFNT